MQLFPSIDSVEHESQSSQSLKPQKIEVQSKSESERRLDTYDVIESSEELYPNRANDPNTKLDHNCKLIETEFEFLNDECIDKFIEIANATSHGDMLTTLYCTPNLNHHYERSEFEVHIDDIQILYEGEIGLNEIGHYICVHYVAEQETVFIYDRAKW